MKSSYTPDWCESLTFNFNFTPGCPQRSNDPGCPPEVELTTVECDGRELPEDVQELLIENLCDRVEGEILEGAR